MHPYLHEWVELPCYGCEQLYLTCCYPADDIKERAGVRESRLCAECEWELHELLAKKISSAWNDQHHVNRLPDYDPAQWHTWEECWGILGKLYSWPLSNDIGETIYEMHWQFEEKLTKFCINRIHRFRLPDGNWAERLEEGEWHKK